MREALVAALCLVVVSTGAAGFHTPDQDFVLADTATLAGAGWYAARYHMADDPNTAGSDPEVRIKVWTNATDWDNLGIGFSKWTLDGQFVGGLVSVFRNAQTGAQLSTTLVPGAEADVAVVEPLTGARGLQVTFHACCGEGHILLTVGADGPVDDVSFRVHDNAFATHRASATGTNSHFFVSEDFEAPLHVAADLPTGEGVRALYAGAATTTGSSGVFASMMVAGSDLGDPPEWCHLRIRGPQYEVESNGLDNDDACGLVARGPNPGSYELRVERYTAPNVLFGEVADVYAVGAFVQFP